MKFSVTTVLLFMQAWAFAHHGAHNSASREGGQLTAPAGGLLSGKAWVALSIASTRFEDRSDRRIIRESMDGNEIHGLRRVTLYSLDAGYGLSDLLSAGLILPYVEFDGLREFHQHGGGHDDGHSHGHGHESDPFLGGLDDLDPDGFGDLTLWAHLSLMRGEFRLGIRAGIELPTGDTHERDGENNRLEASHQPGSGSVDVLLAVAAGFGGDDWSIGVALSSKINTRGTQKYEIGDSIRFSAGGSLTVLTREPVGLDVTLDLWEEWKGRDTHKGRGIETSSGFAGYAAPGLRLRAGPVVLQIASPIQLHNGAEHEPDERWSVGFSAGISF
jgi:hypothetical protein